MNEGELNLWKATLLSWSTRRRVKVGPWEELDKNSGARRYRCEVLIPWDHPWIEFEGNSEALLFVDSKARFGINPYHRQTRIPRHAGEKVILEVERVQTGLMGVLKSSGSLGDVEFAEKDEAAMSCYYDLDVLVEWNTHAANTDQERRLLADGLRKAFEPLALGHLDIDGLRMFAQRPSAPAEEQGLRLALASGKIAGVSKWSQEEKDAAVAHISKTLNYIYKELSIGARPASEIAVMGHAHIDLAWLWRYEETKKKVQRTFCSQIDLLRRFDDWRFGASTPQYYENLFDDQDLKTQITSLVSDGRMEPLGAFWVESDCQLVEAASLIRQLKFGLSWFQKHFGHRCKVAFLPDTFGFASGLPTLLKAAGVELLITTKLNWNDTNEFPWTNFLWVGPDNSELEVQIFGSTSHGYNAPLTITDLLETSQEYQRRGGMGPALYTFGHGDGGGGPDEEMLERLHRYKRLPHLPQLLDLSVDDLVKSDRSKLPRVRGDLYLEYHRGVFSSQSKTKVLIQSMQEALVATELWHTFLQHPSCDEFTDLWKTLLRTNFHDIIPGSSIANVYEDTDQELKETGAELQRRHLALFSKVLREGEDEVVVFGNCAGVQRPEGPVTLHRVADYEVLVDNVWESAKPISENTSRICIGELQPFEIRSYRTRKTTHKMSFKPRSVTRWQKTFNDVSVAISGNGIESLVFQGRELLARRGEIIAWRQHPNAFDAWELVSPKDRVPIPLACADVNIQYEDDDFAVLLLNHVWQGLEVKERITIGCDSPRIDINVQAHMGERRVVLQYHLPTNLVTAQLSRSTSYGVDEVPTISKDNRDFAKFEWPAHRLVDLSEPNIGLSIFNKSRFGHSVDTSTVTVTLATSPLFPDPKAELDATSEIALFPHNGSWRNSKILAHAYAFSADPVIHQLAKSNVDGFQPINGLEEGIIFLGSSVSQDGSGDIVIYLQESHGVRHQLDLSFPKPLRAAFLCTLVDEIDGDCLPVRVDGSVGVELFPWAICAVKLRF